MRQQKKPAPPLQDENKPQRQDVEQERGGAGQHGQHPANEEKKSFRPGTEKNEPKGK